MNMESQVHILYRTFFKIVLIYGRHDIHIKYIFTKNARSVQLVNFLLFCFFQMATNTMVASTWFLNTWTMI